MRTYKIAAIPGDGVGTEVVSAGLDVLQACAARDGMFALDVTPFDWGSARYRRTGALMPDGGVETLKAYDAILFGAVGAPDVPDHVTLWGLRLAICQSLDQYANVRPTIYLMDWDNVANFHSDWDAEYRYAPQVAQGADGRDKASGNATAGRRQESVMLGAISA